MSFSTIYDRAAARKGGEAAMQELLPPVAKPGELEMRGDDRYLSEVTRCVFKAGFVWRVIDSKWPDFEAAFKGFMPLYWQQVPPEVLEGLEQDERIVRNMQKIRTVPENARMIVDAARNFGSFGAFLAQWSSEEQVSLLLWLKRHGARLGGMSAQYFLRRVGWDGFILSPDVLAALYREQCLDASPGTQKALVQAQETFTRWHRETGLPYSHLSRIVSYSIDN